MIKEIEAAYSAYIKKYGREPSILKCSQNVYMAIQHELHCDWDGGDLRYMDAEVIVPDDDGEVNGFEFIEYIKG